MEEFKNQIINISESKYSKEQLVTILELVVDILDIDTVSEIARKNGISRNGVISSNRYRKFYIGKQQFAIKGIKESELPF